MQEEPKFSVRAPAGSAPVLAPPLLAASGQIADRPGSPLFNARQEGQNTFPGRPIHALSALIMVAVDSLWAIFEWLPPVWIFAIPACFVAVFVPAYFIQRHLKQDTLGRAMAFATLLAVLAAVPIPVMSTPVGLGLLAWTGLGKLFGRPPADAIRPLDARQPR